MTKQLMMLFMLAAGAAWGQVQTVTAPNPLGIYPWTFVDNQYGCTSQTAPAGAYSDGLTVGSDGTCDNDLTVPWGAWGQITIQGYAECHNDMTPNIADDGWARSCNQDVFLFATMGYQSQQYIADRDPRRLGTLVTADGLQSNVTAYFYFEGLLYPYWQSTVRADCFDDAEVQQIQDATPC